MILNKGTPMCDKHVLPYLSWVRGCILKTWPGSNRVSKKDHIRLCITSCIVINRRRSMIVTWLSTTHTQNTILMILIEI